MFVPVGIVHLLPQPHAARQGEAYSSGSNHIAMIEVSLHLA